MPLGDRSTTVAIAATAAIGALGALWWHQQRRRRHPDQKESSKGGTREIPDDVSFQKPSARKPISSRDAEARAVAAAANRAAASLHAREAANAAAPKKQLSAQAPEFVPGSAWASTSQQVNKMPAKVAIQPRQQAPPTEPQARARDRSLRERLSIILTTSPVGRHPSTDLIDEVIASMRIADGLADCDMVIVCDGYRGENGDGVAYTEPKYRSGIVDPDSAANYEAYKRVMRSRERAATASAPGISVLELDSRQGFGFAVKAALEHIRTPYVLVMQHDRNFTRPCDIPRLVAAMENNPSKVKYVGLPTNTTCQHAYHVLSKYSLRIEPIKGDARGLELVPLIQWYDSAHICETEYYRQFVFGPRRLVVRGGFIEDKFGQAQLADIRARGVAKAHPEYGTFIASGDSFAEPCIGHLDGRDALNTSKFKYSTTEETSPAQTSVKDSESQAKADPTTPLGVELYNPPIRAKSLFALGEGRREWRSCDVLACNHSKQQYQIRWNGNQDALEIWVSALQLILETPEGDNNAEPEPEHPVPPLAAPQHRAPLQSLAGVVPEPPSWPADTAAKVKVQPVGPVSKAASPSACPQHGWQYVDPKQIIQGPFSLIEMQHWNSKGYFTPDLPMRCSPSEKFVPFRELFPVPLIPFQSPPKRSAQLSVRK